MLCESTTATQTAPPAAAGGPTKFDHIVVYVCDSTIHSYGWRVPIRRTQSAGCLYDTAFARTLRRRPMSSGSCRSGEGALRTSSSYDDMGGSQLSINLQRSSLLGGGGLGGGGACSSINNLDCNDCVSPRVSTNSLASGMDNWGDGSEADPTSESRRVADPSPSSLRRTGVGAACPGSAPTRVNMARLQQHLSPRLQARVDGSLVSRSTSCPSVTNHLKRIYGPPTLTSTAELTGDRTEAPCGSCGAGRHEFGKNLQLGSVESDSFNVTTPTEESQGRVSPLLCTGDEADFQAEADRFLLSAAEREACLRDGRVNGGQDVRYSDVVASQSCGVSADIGEDAAAAAHKSGRLSRSLARTKCLQWLSSLDEGD